MFLNRSRTKGTYLWGRRHDPQDHLSHITELADFTGRRNHSGNICPVGTERGTRVEEKGGCSPVKRGRLWRILSVLAEDLSSSLGVCAPGDVGKTPGCSLVPRARQNPSTQRDRQTPAH